MPVRLPVSKFRRRNRRGAVAIMVAGATVVLLGAMGVGIDTARGYLVRSKLSTAIDAAALAGGRDIMDEEISEEIRMYFDANFPEGYLGADVTKFEVSMSEDRETVDIIAEADIPTTLTAVLGHDSMTVRASNRARRHSRGMELALVMDNTGSMSASEMQAMKDASKALLDLLYGEREAVSNLWISLVPYTATVNVGPGHEHWLTSLDADAYWTAGWKGCVEARPDPHDRGDDPPSVEAFDPFYYASTRWSFTEDRKNHNDRIGDNDWGPAKKPGWGYGDKNHKQTGPKGDHDKGGNWKIKEGPEYGNKAVGPNLGCGPAITPLQSSRSAVEDAIDDMASWSRGGTMANLGLVWGWRTLSPRWRGLWDGIADASLPLDYTTRYMDKAIVILTDGENQWYDWPDGLPGRPKNWKYPDADYTAYGRLSENRLGTTDNGIANQILDDRMISTCERLKDAGILVYTVTFKVSSPDLKNLYRACATGENYWNSPSNSDLAEVFREIGSKLSNLRLER